MVAAVAVMSVPRRMVPGVVPMVMRRGLVAVSRRVMPRVVLVVRWRRVPVPGRVMPCVMLVMRWRRVPVPGRVMPRVMLVTPPLPVSRGMVPRVMVVRVPVVIVMRPRRLVGSDAAVVDTQGVPLADAMPRRRLRRLHGRDAA
jgi:hypothetical protein